ncbi:hypothetical protein TDIS_2130 [Thermosulfurimonas dismutans]|uniref:Uncharacterized protein n=1 Tax=Thermosulfurimonas dismutans TaxID=999894 RepID=A0A179D239_9BACT|nr:hypothetical protein TDIS_2130 [Thermosulfurimonas dismutans]
MLVGRPPDSLEGDLMCQIMHVEPEDISGVSEGMNEEV